MYYINEINPAELTNKAIKNTLKDLDPYTNFYNEQDVEDAKIRREGEYGGIGISVYYSKKGIQINEVYKGFSADKAGLKVGDIIISIDGQSLNNMEREELSTFLKGAPNSTIIIQIQRQGETIEKEISREKISINPVPFSEMIDAETGYILLTRFNSKASSEVKKAFRKLKKAGMKKLVFDLRSNPGGSLLESINISNFFLPKGKIIVSTKAKVKKWSTTYRTTNKPLDLEIPIVVLVNERSASASEIVSGSLQDYDRAVIMGQRSFGKGLVQRYRELTYGTQLKVTISKYYTPSGRCIQELDYANRDKNGNVPKFSEQGINEYKTSNGRTVFDGGGVTPDVIIKSSKKTKATETLLKTRAIFNFSTNYYYQNSQIEDVANYDFRDTDFKNFVKYLQIDTTFQTKQEALFKVAYNASQTTIISKEYNKIKEKLFKEKVFEISKNKDILKRKLKEEILNRYYYKEGVYRHNLKNDLTIKEAVILLQNQDNYEQLLSAK
jgi:carboxyl-terminal processing protease